jgi:hypothetical protein
MKPTSTSTKIAGFFLASLMSATVLGATVAGMQSGRSGSSDVVTVDRMAVSAPSSMAVN